MYLFIFILGFLSCPLLLIIWTLILESRARASIEKAKRDQYEADRNRIL